MKNPVMRFTLICLALSLAHASVSAQSGTLSAAAGDRYVISAKAGAVNFVEGSATIVRKEGKNGQLLKGDTVEIGDRVTTSGDGKVEILLNPGSYLRLGGNSAFEFKTTSLDDLQLRLDSGSAILEVFAAEEFKVAVTTPSTKYLLVETGVYRVDVPSGRHAQLRVWKGRARVGTDRAVKPGRAASAGSAGDISIAKFDRDQKDALDMWSKTRSKDLSKLSDRLIRNDLRASLMHSFLGRRWNLFNSFGLWIFDPFLGGYCFLPFGNGWSSPYGYGFGNSIWWYEMPPSVYMPPPTSGGTNPGGGSAVTPIVSAGDRSLVPPFVRIQQTMGGDSGIRAGGSDPSPSYSSSSSSSSAPISVPVKSEPVPTKQP